MTWTFILSEMGSSFRFSSRSSALAFERITLAFGLIIGCRGLRVKQTSLAIAVVLVRD